MRIKKLIKAVMVIVVLIALFAGAAIVMLTKMVKPAVFKEQLSLTVYSKTGRELGINGNVALSVFPWLGVIVDDITLSNAPRFNEPNFATASKIEVQIKALPLLVGKVEMGKILLKDLNLNLTRKSTGITNWSDIISGEPGTEQGAHGKPSQLSDIYISSVDITNATIFFEDQQKNKKSALKNLHLTSQKVNLQGAPFLLKAEGRFENTEPSLGADFNLSSNFALDLQKRTYSAKGFSLQGELVGGMLKGKVPFGVSADIDSDLNSQNINIDNLKFSLADMNAFGALKATDIIYAPNVVGSLDIPEFDPRLLLFAVGITKDAAVNVAATNVTSNTTIPSDWQKAALKFSIQTTSKFVKIPKLEAKFNDSILTGSGSYAHFNDKIVVFDLDINKIDLDRYLTKQHAQARGASDSYKLKQISNEEDRDKQTSSASKSLFDGLRQVLVNGGVRVGELKFNNMYFNKVEMDIDGEKGNINFKPISFDFYQGKVNADLNLDVRKDVPSIIVNGSMSDVLVKYLCMDMLDTEKLSGIGFLNVKLNTKGDTKDVLMRNLNGTGDLQLRNGDFYGVDVGYQVERGRALLEGKQLQAQESQPPRTFFDKITSNFKITNGVLNTKDLLFTSQSLKVQGSGMANLATQTMDILLQATYLVHGSFYVPIRVTGEFTSPSITPDVAVLLEHFIKDKTDKAIKEIKIKGIKINDKKLKNLLHF